MKELNSSAQNKFQVIFSGALWLYGSILSVACSRSEMSEWMIVVTNQSPKNAIASYLRRWEIEPLFSCLKGRDFNFEKTHLTDPERIEKLMAVLAITVTVGSQNWRRAEIKLIQWEHFKGGLGSCVRRLAVFRYDLDFIRESLVRIAADFKQSRDCIALIRPKNLLLGGLT